MSQADTDLVGYDTTDLVWIMTVSQILGLTVRVIRGETAIPRSQLTIWSDIIKWMFCHKNNCRQSHWLPHCEDMKIIMTTSMSSNLSPFLVPNFLEYKIPAYSHVSEALPVFGNVLAEFTQCLTFLIILEAKQMQFMKSYHERLHTVVTNLHGNWKCEEQIIHHRAKC